MAAYLREHSDADVVYSDEDKLLTDGSLGEPTFKPDFSPDRLLAENYINHFTVVRRNVVAEVGGFREGFDGSQDHDLDAARHRERSTRRPRAGRPVRVANGAGFDGGVRRVQAAGAGCWAPGCRGRAPSSRLEGNVDLGPSPGLYIPRYAITGAPSVDVVVVARKAGADATECIAELERVSTYVDRRITSVIAGDNTPIAINAAVRCDDGRSCRPARRVNSRDQPHVDGGHARAESA